MDLETREQSGARIAAPDDRRLRGHAVVTNALSQNLGGFREIIAPDALDRTFKEAIDLRALVDHESAKILGRLRAGTLEVAKDGTGLRVMIEPDLEITYAGDIVRAVRRGDVSGMSFAFLMLEDDWTEGEDGTPVRTVLDMRISEVSVVTFPAYTQTDIAVAQRSLQDYIATHRRGLSIDLARKLHQTRVA